MTYIFVFVGEFGFELLNWQGVVRKFAKTIATGDRIVCVSRARVEALYESASRYVDISDVECFRSTTASGHYALRYRGWGRYHPRPHTSLIARYQSNALRRELEQHILRELRDSQFLEESDAHQFVFSSHGVVLRGCEFGCYGARYNSWGFTLLSELVWPLRAGLPWLVGPVDWLKMLVLSRVASLDYSRRGDVYGTLHVANNEYDQIQADLATRGFIEGQIGWSLEEPFILCQSRKRKTPQLSADALSEEVLLGFLDSLSEKTGMRVLFVGFQTGRKNDSISKLKHHPTISGYACGSFAEQSCLIHYSDACVFFTEGDLGSQTYVPPLLGHDVHVVAPRSVFSLPSAPLDFWNREVFQFGGQMIPWSAEEVFHDDARLSALAADVMRPVSGVR